MNVLLTSRYKQWIDFWNDLCLCLLGPPKHLGSRDWVFKGAAKSPGLILAVTSPHRQVETFLHGFYKCVNCLIKSDYSDTYINMFECSLDSYFSEYKILKSFSEQGSQISFILSWHETAHNYLSNVFSLFLRNILKTRKKKQ